MIPLDEAELSTIMALSSNQSHIFSIYDLNFLALNHLGELHIYRNNCPHLNKRLANDSFHCFDETFSLIECQFHSAQFLPENGQCVSGPCTGEKLEKFVLNTQGTGAFLEQVNI